MIIREEKLCKNIPILKSPEKSNSFENQFDDTDATKRMANESEGKVIKLIKKSAFKLPLWNGKMIKWKESSLAFT